MCAMRSSFGPKSGCVERWRAVVSTVSGSGADARSLAAYCRDRLAVYKVPRIIEFWREVLKLPNGKIDKGAVTRSPLIRCGMSETRRRSELRCRKTSRAGWSTTRVQPSFLRRPWLVAVGCSHGRRRGTADGWWWCRDARGVVQLFDDWSCHDPSMRLCAMPTDRPCSTNSRCFATTR